MSYSLCKIDLIGNVGKDPEYKSFGNGGGVTKFSVAVSERYEKGGQTVDHTDWFNCQAFGKLAETIRDHVKKGDTIYVDGKIGSSEYEKDGVKHRVWDVTAFKVGFLVRASDRQGRQEPNTQQRASEARPPSTDIPF